MKISAVILALIILMAALISLSLSKDENTAHTPEIQNTSKALTQKSDTQTKPHDSATTTNKNLVIDEPEQTTTETNLSPIDRIRAIQEKTALHESLLKDHDQFTRYPSNNRRFDSLENDPTQKRYLVDERTTLNEDKTLALTAWTSEKFYLMDDTVHIYVTLQDDQQNPINTKFAGHLIYNERDNLESYDFSDTNQDGIYELMIPVTNEKKPLQAGIYKLLIVNAHNDMMESVAFVISEPQAKLTGNYRDRINAEGHLLIEVELEVLEANRYYLEGSLYSSTNDAIGQSSFAENLEKGTHWLPLTFFGLLIQDAGEPGPYVLKHLSLTRVVMPMQRVPLTTPDYHTDNYTLDQFSNQRYAE